VLTIILAESELELVPSDILKHPGVLTYAKKHGKKPEKTILDSSYHHRAMKMISESERRGRPDIVHIFLLNALESIANKKGELKIIIHTRNNQAIYVNPETRIIRNYPRFIGLMEQLFEKKKISAEDKILIELKNYRTLENLLGQEKYDSLIVFSPNAKKVKLASFINDLKKKKVKNILCVIGGFPHGDFHFDFSKVKHEKISIFEDDLTVWTVLNELIVNYENSFL
jgi:rRNA small subunit pseudouridine methyltransferase Nep1